MGEAGGGLSSSSCGFKPHEGKRKQQPLEVNSDRRRGKDEGESCNSEEEEEEEEEDASKVSK